jgi:hypothetical protein
MTDEKQRRDLASWSFAIPCVVALCILGVTSALWLQGVPVPAQLDTLLAATVGYVFGVLPGIVKDFLGRTA